jgi:hypothetical protein
VNPDASLSLLDVCDKLLDEPHDANDQWKTADTCCLSAAELFAWLNMRISCCNTCCRDRMTGTVLPSAGIPNWHKKIPERYRRSPILVKVTGQEHLDRSNYYYVVIHDDTEGLSSLLRPSSL